MAYLGATSDVKTKFLSQFAAKNTQWRGVDASGYGEYIQVVPYGSSSSTPSETWFKVSNSGFATLGLNAGDEFGQWVKVENIYYVKESALDFAGYQPVSDGTPGGTKIASSGFDFKKYLPFIAAGGAALVVLVLLLKKRS